MPFSVFGSVRESEYWNESAVRRANGSALTLCTYIVIVNISALFYKLTFRKRTIVKPSNILKLVHRMERPNLHISKTFKTASVTPVIVRPREMFTLFSSFHY